MSKNLVVLAFHPPPDREGRVRAYLKKQDFGFTTLLGKVQNGEMPFGMTIIGSAVLIGADGKVAWRAAKFSVAEARRALEQLPNSK